jgi:ubiquinone/menaquinone biosynthesis C-methylase UbiE
MTAPTIDQVKTRQQQTWSSGDYGRIAWITVPLADVLCEAVDLQPGTTVLDVASGTGHVALAAGRRFCRVTGVDFVPELLDVARRRALAEGLSIEFEPGDAESLPYEDDSFDYVMSAIGVMFAANQEQAASELVRVCRPGGTIGMANWTPTGFVGQMFATVGRHRPPPAGARPPTTWGTEERVRELFGDRVSDVRFTTASVTERFPTAEFFADFFIEHYGPTLKASEALDGDAERRAFRNDLVALAERANRSTGDAVVCDWEYLVTVATKA